ncbi:MAG: Rab family GTPase [Promethearchaeota archaeon]|jgi:small GTP-binding protein
MYDAILKTVIFGDVGCGKTTLRKRFMTKEFEPICNKTIGVDFQTKDCKFDGMEVKLMIWDFAGERRFRYMFPEYLKGAMGGIMMYDITNYSSFSDIRNWISLIQETNQGFPIILLGSKLDLDVLREIPRKEGIAVAKSMGFSGFIECSSKTGENVELLFEVLIRLIINNMVISEKQVQSITT